MHDESESATGELLTRKIQKTGGTTYTVSLPKQWADANGLSKGTEVFLHPHDDGSLEVATTVSETGELDETTLDVGECSPVAVRRTVRAAYRSGFDRIVLTAEASFDDEQRRAATETTRTLVGFECFEQSDDRIVLRNLLDTPEVSIQQTALQLQFVALSMHRRATSALQSTDAAVAREIIDRDDEADRLYDMVGRHFNRALASLDEVDHLGVDRPRLFEYYRIARQLERVADHAVDVATVAKALDGPLPDPVSDVVAETAEEARTVVEVACEGVVGERDVNRAYEALERQDDLSAEVNSLADDRAWTDRDDVPGALLVSVCNSLTRTAECGGNVAVVAIQSHARAGSG